MAVNRNNLRHAIMRAWFYKGYKMKKIFVIFILFELIFLIMPIAQNDKKIEDFLENLPYGIFLKNFIDVPAEQIKIIEKKLGGNIQRVTNSVLQVQGRLIQINVITAGDESAARIVYAAISKIKSYPFCLQKDKKIIEYIGKDIDIALAMKTSYELGFLDKPSSLQYRVIAELATVEKADYMACNLLFNYFLILRNTSKEEDIIYRITELAKKFKFGNSLILRNPKLGPELAAYQFPSKILSINENIANISYNFSQLSTLQNIPYITVTMDITVDDIGLYQTAISSENILTQPTLFWPVDDPFIKSLAKQITYNKISNKAKVQAILEWLTPGKNIKYSGEIGSRWGVRQVFEQKFGHCWDFSDCFITLCRASNIPCRQVAGWLYGVSGHVWAEFYLEDKGWQQVDTTGGGKFHCGIYHIPYFTSEDGEMPIVYISMPKIEIVEKNIENTK